MDRKRHGGTRKDANTDTTLQSVGKLDFLRIYDFYSIGKLAANREKRFPLPKSAHGLVSEKTNKSIVTKQSKTKQNQTRKPTERGPRKQAGILVRRLDG